jgi:hypothetical protein
MARAHSKITCIHSLLLKKWQGFCISHFVQSMSTLLRHKNLQTTEIYLQAIDPRFRETMRLLEGNVISFLSETLTENQNLLTTYSPTSP